MRILLGTNIVLDVLLNREPFVRDSSRLWEAADEGVFDACRNQREESCPQI